MNSLSATKSEIVARIERVGELAERAEELHEETKRIEERQRQIEEKNRVFDTLKRTLTQVQERYSTLQKWVSLAESMDATIPQNEISETITELDTVLRAFRDQRYGDFERASEVTALKDTIDNYRTTLNEHITDVQRSVETSCDDLETRVSTTETVLRIPDVGDAGDDQKVQKFKSVIEDLKKGSLVEAGEYREIKSAYETVEIDIDAVTEEHGLSEDAGDVLLRFLNNETVTLAEIDGATLAELQTLEEFSERLTIQFYNQ